MNRKIILLYLVSIYNGLFCNDSHYIAVVTAWIVSVINHINTQAETDIKTLVKISVLFFYTILII